MNCAAKDDKHQYGLYVIFTFHSDRS